MDAIAYTQGGKAISLGFKANLTGSYTIRLSESDIGEVVLTDTLTGISTERFTVTVK